MGEAKRRNALGLPPRGEKFETGVSSILDGQVPLQCGSCRQEIIPEGMVFFGLCSCGSSAGSMHFTEKGMSGSRVRYGLAMFLMGLIERLIPDVVHSDGSGHGH